MIAALRGKITRLLPLQCTIDVGGVSYLAHIPLFVYEALQGEADLANTEITLYTRVVYSENDRALYAFLSEIEAEVFDFLRSLHGIGPKLVLSILSHLPPGEVLELIEKEDEGFLIKIPGIGKSKAQKVIFEGGQKKKQIYELKHKFSASAFAPGQDELEMASPSDEALERVESALSTLGFATKEIRKAQEKINLHFQKNGETPPELNLENTQTWIRLFLQFL